MRPTEEISSGMHSGRIRPSFLKGFFVSNATPRAVCASMMPESESAKTGMKRMAVVSVNAYLYGTCRRCTSTPERSLICVTESSSASGIVAPISLRTRRRPVMTPRSVTRSGGSESSGVPVRTNRSCRRKRKTESFKRPRSIPAARSNTPPSAPSSRSQPIRNTRNAGFSPRKHAAQMQTERKIFVSGSSRCRTVSPGL